MPRPARAAGVTVASLLLVGGFAAPAFAHVSVNPDSATQGGFATLTFRVPTESDSASTLQVQVVFPPGQPLASVSVKPHPGWSYTVVKTKLATPISSDDGQVTEAVSEITWKADSIATAVQPGQFEEFEVSAGPLPTSASMTFKALQTYTNGQVVRWIEQSAPGAAEPEHPALVLTLKPAVSAGATTSGNPAVASAAVKPASAPSTDSASSSQVAFATALAALALLVGIAGGLLGATALRRRQTSSRSVEAAERVEAKSPM